MENTSEKPFSSDQVGSGASPFAPLVVPKVTGLHPKLADAVAHLLTEAKARKLDVGLNCGLRTAQEQDALYAQGRTRPGDKVTNAMGWESWHNYGLAVDIVFKDEKGHWTWNKKPEDWEQLGVVGEMFGLKWGGRWKSFRDFPHFEKTPLRMTIHEAKDIVFEKGIDVLWGMV